MGNLRSRPLLPECPSPSVTQAFASRQGECCSKNVRNKAQNSPSDLRREWTSALETEGTEGAGAALVFPEPGEGSMRRRPALWKAPGKDQPPENEACAFPRYRSEFSSQGSLGVNQQQQLLQQPFWELRAARPATSPAHNLQGRPRRREVGAGQSPGAGSYICYIVKLSGILQAS